MNIVKKLTNISVSAEIKKTAEKSAADFVWDKVVRITHWSVAVIVFANLFFTKGGETPHRYLGYIALGLIGGRLLWSLTWANPPSRLLDLIPTVRGFREHLAEIKQRREGKHRGHNAFGLLAVWAMWACIVALGITGILYDSDWGIDNDIDDWHASIAEILKFIVILHIVAVLITSWWLKRNLVKSMR